MAVVPMSKILLLLHNEDKQKTLELLQDQGVMEIIDNEEEEISTESIDTEEHGKISFKIAEVEFALNFLNKYAPTNKGLEGMVLGEKVKIQSFQDIHNIRKNFFYQDIIEKCKNLEEELNQYKVELADLGQELADLKSWQELKLDLSASRVTETTKLIVGSIDKKRAEECFIEIEESGALSEQHVIEEGTNQTRFWLLVEKDNLAEVESILQKYNFNEFLPKARNGVPKEVTKDLLKEEKEVLKKIEILENERKKIAKDVPDLKVIYDYLNWVRGKEEVKNQFGYTESTVSITGFVPKENLETLQKELANISNSITLEELKITEDDDIPVELKNKKMIRPFESLMSLFGLPASNEADPTPYLTPFFLIFFGFCLTDVGYGLTLGLGLFILLRLVKFDDGMGKMLRLLMYGGWITVVMGVLFGGYLGLTVDQAPAFMVNAEGTRFKFQIFDPINNLNAVMAFAYGLGLIQLWFGTFLKGIQQWKTSKSEALQTSFSYNLLIILLIIFSLASAGVVLEAQAEMIKNILLATTLFVVWGSGYGTKNIIVRPIIGMILFLQEMIAIFSNILSYSRLFALGLATGIIALVFNSIALTMFELLPIYAAIPVMIFIIVIGHTLNIALSVMGAFIHSARLQFVEFFGKFFLGGGKTFEPFKKEMKYISLDRE